MATLHPSVETLAKGVARKYGFNQCRPCATELRQAFIGAGKTGRVLRLATKGGLGFIVMRDPRFALPFSTPGNSAIADSGQHFGVQVGDYVFDNIHRAGILRSAWEATFDCDVHAFSVFEIEPF